MEEQLGHLVVVVVLGISAQWISWRLNLPSILLLLLFGIVAGPVLGLLHPDRLLGPLLLPVVLLSVALILYEGGLSLRLRELRQVGSVVRNLVTLGTLVTWLGGALAAYLLFDLAAPLAALVGAIFVVTGPTVVGPLLRHVRPSGAVGPILKWEGIVTDPLGAMLAVLIFEILVDDRMHQAPMLTLFGVLKTLLLGGAVGAAGAWLLWHLLRRHLVPDFLQNPLSLMLVLMVFTVGMLLESEAGLVGVTLMGVLLANQRSAPIRHIIEFKENLRVLLISTIFILLAARLEVEHLKALGWRHFAFLGALVLVVRPLTVFLSTWRTGLTLREKAFLSSVAPRGIVAAAVSAVLGLELSQRGYDGAELLVPLTFLVIIGTVLFYGIIATPVARKLGLSEPARQGYLILGAHPWARALGRVFQEQGIPLLLVDSNRQNVSEAHLAGLPAEAMNLLEEHALDEIDLSGLGRFLALTPNDEVNTLACLHLEDVLGRSAVYQLVAGEGGEGDLPKGMGGRRLFDPGATFGALQLLHDQGAIFKTTGLSEELDVDSYRSHYGEGAMPLFVIAEPGKVRALTARSRPVAHPGETLISLVFPWGPAPRES